MYHEFSSICQSKFLGPLTLNRIASGNGRNMRLDRHFDEVVSCAASGPKGCITLRAWAPVASAHLGSHDELGQGQASQCGGSLEN